MVIVYKATISTYNISRGQIRRVILNIAFINLHNFLKILTFVASMSPDFVFLRYEILSLFIKEHTH